MEPLNVSIAEAARMIGVSAAAMQRWLESGEINAWREGRNWKIPISELIEWNIERARRETKERRETA